jgi:hypothetical protein
MFPVYGGKCLSSKAVHDWVGKFSQRLTKVAKDGRPGADVTETVVRIIFYAAGFDALLKRRGECINVGGGCREINVLSIFEYQTFLCFVFICDLFGDSPS